MAVHEFFTQIEQNDVIGLVDGLAAKAGTPYHGTVPNGSTTAVVNHNLNTSDVDVTVYRVSDGLQVGVPVDRTDANNVSLTFGTAPTGGQYRVIVSAGTGAGGGGGGGGGDGGVPAPHAASHASDGTDPVSPASIGAAGSSHNHAALYAALVHTHTLASLGAAAAVHTHIGVDIASGTVPIGRLPTGTTSTTVSLGNHTHSGGAVAPHATTHALGGTDALSPEDIGASGATHDHNGRIIPAGGLTGESLIKVTDDDFDVAWGAGSGDITIPEYGPTVIKPFPPVPVTITPFYYRSSYDTPTIHNAHVTRLNASLGTHFRIDYTPGSNGQLTTAGGPLLRITNPVDGQSILIEYRNLASAASQDQGSLTFNEENFVNGTWGVNGAYTYSTVSGQTAGPGASEITHFDLGGMQQENILWQSVCYYSLIYDARGRSNTGLWRLISLVPGFGV